MMAVRTITCPACNRVWPEVSEQGLYVKLFCMCHHCVTRKVIAERDKVLKRVDYVIINCYDCAAQNPSMSGCETCAGTGWLPAEKE